MWSCNSVVSGYSACICSPLYKRHSCSAGPFEIWLFSCRQNLLKQSTNIRFPRHCKHEITYIGTGAEKIMPHDLKFGCQFLMQCLLTQDSNLLLYIQVAANTQEAKASRRCSCVTSIPLLEFQLHYPHKFRKPMLHSGTLEVFLLASLSSAWFYFLG